MIDRINDGANFTTPTGDGKEAPVVIAYLQPTLLTKGDSATSRLRVDVAQTGFFDGREFRTFRPRNLMTSAPAYAAQNVLTAGGTHTGGTVIDVLAARAAGATAQASSVGMGLTSERGIAPGTYYFRLTNPGSGTAVGKLSAWWEERP